MEGIVVDMEKMYNSLGHKIAVYASVDGQIWCTECDSVYKVYEILELIQRQVINEKECDNPLNTMSLRQKIKQ